MRNDKALSALGFARRAGKCTAGETGCEAEWKAHRTRLILLDAAASENTKDHWQFRCEASKIPCLILEGAAEAAGKPGKMVFSIPDSDFSAMIQNAVKKREANSD